MERYDLVVRNGTVVTAGGRAEVDVGIRGEKVVQLGGTMTGDREIDAGDLLVLPGMVDLHTHLSVPPGGPPDRPSWVDDYETGTASALAGGVTTVGGMVTPAEGETPLEALEREAEVVGGQALEDVVLHPVVRDPTPEVLSQIPTLLERGHSSIKMFMCTPVFDQKVESYLEAIVTAGRLGMLSIIHCEDYALIEHAVKRLEAEGRDGLRYYAESRTVTSEQIATERAVGFALDTGSPILVVHLSSRAALDACRRGQEAGAPVYVETRPLYLHLTSELLEEPDGAKYVGQPPLREPQDVEAIWAGLAQGTVHTIGSDHAPWRLEDKLDPGLSVRRLRPGVANLEEELPMLYSEGVRKGRISLERLVQVTATNPAKLGGLYPRKGTVAVGSDADLVLLDPNLTRPVGAPRYSRSDYSAFEGWEVTGWPVMTIRRGAVVCEDGEVLVQSGSGKLLPRGKITRF